MTPVTFYIPCLFGLEALVGDELRRNMIWGGDKDLDTASN